MSRLVEGTQFGVMLLLPALALLLGASRTVFDGQAGTIETDWLVVAAALAPLVCGIILRVMLPGADLPLVASCGMLTSVSTVALLQIAEIPRGAQLFFQTITVRHLAFVVASFAAMVAGAYMSRLSPLVLRFPYLTATTALGLILSTMLLGTEVNGAKLWIVVGAFRLQPAEVARVLLALFVAAYLYDRRHLIASSWQLGRLHLPPIPYLVPVAGAVGVALAALAIQNDLGMAALTALGAFAIIAGSLRSRWSVFAIGAAVAIVVWFTANLSPRVRARVENWLDPWQAPMGAGYQFIQGEYGLATGGIAGASFSPDVRNVPEIQTDFILAAIGAQAGLLVSVAVLVLLAVVVLRCARNAMIGATDVAKHMGLALTVLLGLQIILILGGVLRLLPLTGLTIPFVSYGGTSMLVTGFTVGLIIGIGGQGRGRATR